jgi:hypothetical protein
MATCNSTGGDIQTQPNYACNTGYFPSGAPEYCARMFN